MVSCDFVKNSIISYLQTETEILATPRACIISLPIKLLDGINIEIFIEEAMGGFRIHDGGKAIGNLESSGMVVTERKLDQLTQLARRMGVSFDDGVFQSFAKSDAFQDVVLSVAQCCSATALETLKHAPSTEEDQIKYRVSVDINKWGQSRGFAVFANRKLPGKVKQYSLDFVAETPHAKIGVNVLVPSYNSTVSAERYALQLMDVGAAGYRRVAVLAKPRLWRRPAREIVGKVADAVAEFDENEGFFAGENNISETLDRVAA
ncbi:MAG: DUF1828 domain-containing protein [Terriglobia bacterium]